VVNRLKRKLTKWSNMVLLMWMMNVGVLNMMVWYFDDDEYAMMWWWCDII